MPRSRPAAAKTMLEQQGIPLSMVPCVVVTVTPLTINLLGSTVPVPAVKIPGLTYSTGNANALVASRGPSIPTVLPIG